MSSPRSCSCLLPHCWPTSATSLFLPLFPLHPRCSRCRPSPAGQARCACTLLCICGCLRPLVSVSRPFLGFSCRVFGCRVAGPGQMLASSSMTQHLHRVPVCWRGYPLDLRAYVTTRLRRCCLLLLPPLLPQLMGTGLLDASRMECSSNAVGHWPARCLVDGVLDGWAVPGSGTGRLACLADGHYQLGGSWIWL